MPRKERPVKIKRYNRGNGSSARISSGRGRNYLGILAVLLAFALIFVFGRSIIRALTREKPEPVSSEGTVVSRDVSPDENREESEDLNGEEPYIPGSILKSRIYYYADVTELSDRDRIDRTVAQAREKGANCLVFDAKTREGYITWNTSNRYGSKLLYDSQIDIGYLTEKLRENSIAPVARIYTFMDRMISTVVRSTAVMYSGTETRWLDSSAELGGKAWANPASPVMQQYISDLTEELMGLGVKDFIYAAFHTPTGYSLEYRDFGVPMESVLANMTSLLKTLRGRISSGGGSMLLQVEYSAVTAEGNYAQYISHPFQLGCSEYIVTASSSKVDAAGVTEEMKVMMENDPSIDSITLWLTPDTQPRTTSALGNWFVG